MALTFPNSPANGELYKGENNIWYRYTGVFPDGRWVTQGTLGSDIDITTVLNDISDVVITTPTNGQRLEYSTGNWINVANEVTWGSVTGTLSNQTDLNVALSNKVSHVAGVVTLNGAVINKVESLVSGSTVSIDASLSNYYTLFVTADTTLELTSLTSGTNFKLEIINDGIARQLTFSTGFESLRWPGGVQPPETIGVDLYEFDYNGAFLRGRLIASYTS